MITTEQAANLRKLSSYLRNMPEEYARDHFLMSFFAACTTEDAIEEYGSASAVYHSGEVDLDELSIDKFVNQKPNSQYACGTCACAIGHGPAAGIPVKELEWNWNQYSERVFGMGQVGPNGDAWVNLFGPHNEDDPYLAADRIDAFLKENNL